MRDDTEFSLDALFPDLENYSDSKKIEPEISQPLTRHDLVKLVLALEEKVDRTSARRMFLHHVEPPLKPYVPKLQQDVPLYLKLAQTAALRGNIPDLQASLMDYLRESKSLTPAGVVVLEEQPRIVH